MLSLPFKPTINYITLHPPILHSIHCTLQHLLTLYPYSLLCLNYVHLSLPLNDDSNTTILTWHSLQSLMGRRQKLPALAPAPAHWVWPCCAGSLLHSWVHWWRLPQGTSLGWKWCSLHSRPQCVPSPLQIRKLLRTVFGDDFKWW